MQRHQRGIGAFMANLRQPMPLREKLRLIIRNRAHIPIPACCGHPGEPGC